MGGLTGTSRPVRWLGDEDGRMTLVAVWQFSENRIHAIADSRISSNNGVLTEHGPKLLPLTVLVRKPAPSGFFHAQAFSRDFGFAYSGATLPALSSHALASALLGNLTVIDETARPSMTDLAMRLAGIAYHYMMEVGQVSGVGAKFSSIFFGMCPVENKPLAYLISPTTQDGRLAVKWEKHALAPSDVLIIGNGVDQLRERIEEKRSKAKHEIVFADAPKHALQALINDKAIESVGGTVQQLWVTPAGVELAATTGPIMPRPSAPRNAGLFVLGFDLMDMQAVGPCKISLSGR
jgi:hypothetical protein